MTITIHPTRTPRGDLASITLFPDEPTAREMMIDVVRALGATGCIDLAARIQAWDEQFSGPGDEARDHDRAQLDTLLDELLDGEDPAAFLPTTILAHELPGLVQRLDIEVHP